ncbi:glycosyl transferase [Paenibacillus baekrokdamisoli]|uniref:4,4'-diaponeurosporenoate glycosyltransferase n=1 Tax=Paenibacillus baekrokdamisoli TaxID=1712516 RepID=A0A3G9J2T6_9BACL|nr:glycosyltransferase family 2 protein [Paenibacillus baekrokdamisoli]MBB3072741.1 glycosyltransferase involved in cell wall biosynthesis [Paenibacillus baekrokdamisoli]BBH20131.1 glycosyl transferase [Paenibacillus baekrokdamisoli]
MWIIILLLMLVGCLSGFFLFKKNTLAVSQEPYLGIRKLSIIIPARNEECNLPHLLDSLKSQTFQPFEIIVVDDFSDDRTKEIAESYGVKVITGRSLPQGWTGKNWAVWNGYLHASGDVFAFLDADIRLAPNALASLMKARERSKGVISVVPFHHTEKLYEKLALIMNMLGIFAFTSVFEKKNPKKGLYGSCILALREDYEKINGHESVKSEVLDDLFLGSKFIEAGVAVTNFIGYGLVSFRMYPQGIRSEIEGFSKGAVLSTSTLSLWTIVPIAIWVVGLIVSETVFIFANTSWAVPLLIGYFMYMFQLFYFIKYVGVFGIMLPVLHIVGSLFFIVIMIYSLYQVVVLGHVRWKGRHIRVGGKRGR